MQWEYMTVVLPHRRQTAVEYGGERAARVEQNEAVLDFLGRLRWELVSVFSDAGTIYGYLKRPLSEGDA